MLGHIASGSQEDVANTVNSLQHLDVTESGLDDTDGVLQMDGPVDIRHDQCPEPMLVKQCKKGYLSAAPMSQNLLEQAEDEDHHGKSLFMKNISKFVKKMKNIVHPGCTSNNDKVVLDYGVKQVDIRDPNAKSKKDEWVSFGMNIKTIKEDNVLRHYVQGIEKDSVAEKFQLKDQDELLMLQEDLIVNRSTLVVLDLFSKLSSNKPTTLITRRKLTKSYDEHIVYEYFIFSGQFKIIDETENQVRVDQVDKSYGVGDHIIDVKNDGCTKRAFKTTEDTYVRVDEREAGLDASEDKLFYFWVQQYTGYDWFLEQNVNIWVMKHQGNHSCQYISQSSDGAHAELKKGEDTEDYKALGGPEKKWITVAANDGDSKRVFRNLKGDMYLGVKGRKVCVIKKNSQKEAFDDSNTVFHVHNEPTSPSNYMTMKTTQLTCRGFDNGHVYRASTTEECTTFGEDGRHFVYQGQETDVYVVGDCQQHAQLSISVGLVSR